MDVGFSSRFTRTENLQRLAHQTLSRAIDDLNQPAIFRRRALREIIRRLLVDFANNPARPEWKHDSFFRRYAKTDFPPIHCHEHCRIHPQLGFPHATEQVQWGHDLVFKIGGKMFAITPLEPHPSS